MKRVLFYLAKMANARRVVPPLSPSDNKTPNKLYDLCLSGFVNTLNYASCGKKSVLRTLPESVVMDIYSKMLFEGKMDLLRVELSDLSIFERLIRFNGSHVNFLRCFQSVVEHGCALHTELATAYLTRCDEEDDKEDSHIELGLRLGGFLNEAGWYADAQRVLIRCRDICLSRPLTTYYKRLALECCHRLLNTQSGYCCFPAAAETYSLALKLMGVSKNSPSDSRFNLPGSFAKGNTCTRGTQTDDDDEELDIRFGRVVRLSEAGGGGGAVAWGGAALAARLCREFSSLFFVRCDYTLAHAWAMRALRLLTPTTPPIITVEVLRACAKACVVKRKFSCAGAAARHAVCVARRTFGLQHHRYALALLDYGFYLLNIDSIVHSVAVYEEAIGILCWVFGRRNMHVAAALEDIAYALYVLEYSSGRFYKARENAEEAIRITETLVPPDHLLLASAKRVKALILEEIALDTPTVQDMMTSKPALLEESEALHKAALELSMMAFGEKNVQTAKHYGNLGRLYQSMNKLHDAEAMHLKAIAIKEELLGPDDYEVGLSIGHLASLYNYHMGQYAAAERLYLRSIAISSKLFGERYSGLEYDYRGLIHVFTQLKRPDTAEHYTRMLQRWSVLREQYKAEPQPAHGLEDMISLKELKEKFFGPND